MKGICYIVGAGELYGDLHLSENDFLIAADGGYDKLLLIGIKPNVLIGDLDSIKSIPSDIKTIRHPVQKDETDMFLAYKMGVKLGYDRFAVYGGTGGREDHTFANYSLLLYAKNERNAMILFGDHTKIQIIKNEKIILNGSSGGTVSVFAVSGDARGVSIKGLKYEAENITLSCDFPLGVSNSFIGREAVISVDDGALLIMEEY